MAAGAVGAPATSGHPAMIRPGGGRRCIDWDSFFARPGSRDMTAPEIGLALGVGRERAREAAKRRNIALPAAKPGLSRLPPWTAQANAAMRKRIRNRSVASPPTDHEATLAELAALQAVPRYDAVAA